MPEIRCLIVEDEKLGQDILLRKLSQFFPRCKVVGIAESVKSATGLLNTTKPDIVFMDVQIKGGTAFDILSEFPERGFHVIFLTAYSHYAIEALNKSAAYYLLKPIDDDEFCKGVQRVVDEITRSNESEFVLINTSGEQRQIRHDDIFYLEADGPYTTIVTQKEHILVSRNIGSFEDSFPAYRYVRCHYSFLVNLSHVSLMDRSEWSVVMENGTALPISRRKHAEVVKKMTNFKGRFRE
ncbi:MAG: LytR/AlgR family response regulator transcription factor [Bacteroidota bacterium]